MSPLSVMRLLFTAFWVVAFAYAAWAARDFAANSGVFPGTISLIGLLIAAAALVSAVRAALRERAAPPVATHAPGGPVPSGSVPEVPKAPDSGELNPLSDTVDEEPISFRRSARYGAWLVGLILGIWLVGAVIAAGVFVGAFLAVEARANWKWLIAGPLLIMGLLIALANGINLYWPETLLRL